MTVLLIVLIYLLYKYTSVHLRSKQNKKIHPSLRLSVLESLFIAVNKIANVPIFMVYGTLLGFHRDNKLICYDYDIDLGVLIKHRDQLLYNLHKYLDKNIYKIDTTVPWSIYNVVHKETNLALDIFVYNSNKTNIWRYNIPCFYSKVCKERLCNMPISWVLPLRPVRFLGVNTYIPNNPHKVLNNYYGNDYVIPNHICNDDCTKCIPRRKKEIRSL